MAPVGLRNISLKIIGFSNSHRVATIPTLVFTSVNVRFLKNDFAAAARAADLPCAVHLRIIVGT